LQGKLLEKLYLGYLRFSA